MPRFGYRFSNLCGTVYRCGNLIFTPNGNALLSAVGNRVTVFDLVQHSSHTLPCECRKNISRMALSHDGRLLLCVDEEGRALLINLPKRVIICRFNFKARVRALSFSPDDTFVAVSHRNQVHVWRTPLGSRATVGADYAPFVLHRRYTGHHGEVSCVSWSSDGRFLLSGARDRVVRIYSLFPLRGFSPLVLAGHRGAIVTAEFLEGDGAVVSVSRDGAVFVWRLEKEWDEEGKDHEEGEEEKEGGGGEEEEEEVEEEGGGGGEEGEGW